MGKFIKLFTLFTDDETEHIMQKFLKKTDSRYAQERLAEAVTLLVHGGTHTLVARALLVHTHGAVLRQLRCPFFLTLAHNDAQHNG